MGRLVANKAHMFHTKIHPTLNHAIKAPAVIVDSWTLPAVGSGSEIDTTALFEITHVCCRGCNNIPHQNIGGVQQTTAVIMKRYKTKAERIVAFLIMQVVHLFMELSRPSGVARGATFRAKSLIAFYASAAMFTMYLHSADALQTTDFLYFHQFCFVELPLHDKWGHTVYEALQADIDSRDKYDRHRTRETRVSFGEDNSIPPGANYEAVQMYRKVARNLERLYNEHYHAIRDFERPVPVHRTWR